MGQTLTHGVYLPDEGERNCYNGLAANWSILDGAVGTIAEHTTALAGKAPAVHTHTKSDITDLFNSANTWTALNTYTNGQLALKATSQEIGVIPASDRVQFLSLNDKNNEQIGVVGIWYNSSGSTEMRLSVSDKFKDGVKDPTGTKTSEIVSFGMASSGDKFFAFEGKLGTSLYPFTTNFYNIGSSANQWNNLYAKRVNTQSVNGVNPGALSLPSENASSVNLDPTNWNVTGTTANRYTPPADGWLGVQVMSKDTVDLTGQYLFAGRATGGSDYYSEGCTTSINVNSGQGTLMGVVFIPVISGKEYHIRIKIGIDLTNGSSITARFYTCLGNV